MQIPNVKPIVAQLKNEFKDVAINVNVKINPNSVRQLRSLNTELKTLQASLTSISSSTISLGGLTSSLSTLQKSTRGGATGIRQQASAVQSLGRNAATAGSQMELFGKQSALAIRRFAAFSIATGGILSFLFAIKGGIQEAILFDREMVKLSQVTNTSVRGLKDLSDEITRLSTKFGVSSTELLDVSSTLAQAGLSAKDTKVALEALAKSSLAPSFDNLKDTTEAVIAVMRQFDIPAKDVEKALGSINAVSNVFAVESKDILAAIRQTGGAFASASKGVSEGKDALNEFIAVFTSIRQTTRESAETIATGLRTIFTRIERPKTIQYLKDFGIELLDVEGKFVGPYEASKRLAAGLKDLDSRSTTFLGIQEELGGYRQISKVIPLLKQFAVSQEALKVAQQGSNSLTDNATTALNALSVQVSRVKEQFLALIRAVTETDGFKNITTGVLGLTSGMIALADSLRPILPYLTAIAAVKLAFGAANFGRGFAPGIFGKGSTAQSGVTTSIGNMSPSNVYAGSSSSIRRQIRGNPGDTAAGIQSQIQTAVNAKSVGGGATFSPTLTQLYRGIRRKNPNLSAQDAHNFAKDYLSSQLGPGQFSTNSVASGQTGLPNTSRFARIRSGLGSIFNSRLGKGAAFTGIAGAAALQGALGNDTPTTAVAGGLVSGGVAGGITGGLLTGGSPIGIAVGAAVGALTQAINGFKEANLKESVQKLTESIERLDTTFEQFSRGEVGQKEFNEDAGRFGAAANKLNPGIPGVGDSSLKISALSALGGYFGYSSGKSINGLYGGTTDTTTKNLQNRISDIQDKQNVEFIQNRNGGVEASEKYFKLLAAQGKLPASAGEFGIGTYRGGDGREKTFDKFNPNAFGQTNEEAIRNLATRGPEGQANAKRINAQVNQFRAGPEREALRAQLLLAAGAKILAKISENFEKTSTAAERAAIQVEILSQTFEKVSDSVQRVLAESDKYQIGNENILSRVNATPTVGRIQSRSDVFANPNGYSPEEVRTQFKGLGLNGDVSKNAENTLVGLRVLTEHLPKALLNDRLSVNKDTGKLNNAASDPLVGGNYGAVTKAIQRLEQEHGFELPNDTKEQIVAKISQNIGQNRQAGGESEHNYLEEDLAKTLAPFGAEIQKAAEDLQKGFEEVNKRYGEGVDKVIHAQLNAAEKTISAQQIGAHGRLTLQKFRGQTSSIADLAAPDNVRIDALAGFKGAAANPGQIVQNINAANTRIAANQAAAADLAKTNVSDPGIKDFVDAIAEDKQIQIKSIQALEALTHATAELTGIEQKLALEQSKRTAGQNALNSVFGASPRELRQHAIENQAFQQFQKTGQIPNGIFAQQGAQNIKAGFERAHANETDPQKQAALAASFYGNLGKQFGPIGGNVGENIRAAGTVPGRGAGEIPLINRGAGVLANQEFAGNALANQARPDGLQANLNAERANTVSNLTDAANAALGGKNFKPRVGGGIGLPPNIPVAPVQPDVQAAPAAGGVVGGKQVKVGGQTFDASDVQAIKVAKADQSRRLGFKRAVKLNLSDEEVNRLGDANVIKSINRDDQYESAKQAGIVRRSDRDIRNGERTPFEINDPEKAARVEAAKDRFEARQLRDKKKRQGIDPTAPLAAANGVGQGMFNVPDNFAETAKTLSIAGDKLSAIPTKITLETTGSIDVRVLGTEGLQDGLRGYLMQMINEQLKKVVPLDARLEKNNG